MGTAAAACPTRGTVPRTRPLPQHVAPVCSRSRAAVARAPLWAFAQAAKVGPAISHEPPRSRKTGRRLSRSRAGTEAGPRRPLPAPHVVRSRIRGFRAGKAQSSEGPASLLSALQARPPASLNSLGDGVLTPMRGSFPLDGPPAEKSQLLGVSTDPHRWTPQGVLYLSRLRFHYFVHLFPCRRKSYFESAIRLFTSDGSGL